MIRTLLFLAWPPLRHLALCLAGVVLFFALLAIVYRQLGLPVGLATAHPVAVLFALVWAQVFPSVRKTAIRLSGGRR